GQNNLYISGIGTTNPGAKLDVAGNIGIGASTSENTIRFYGVSGDGPGSYNHTVIAERLFAGVDRSELLLFKGNDPDGPGVGDRIRLDTTGSIVFQTGGGNRVYNPSVEGLTRMIITSDGNVGIGTTTPAYKLDVAGDTRVTGNVYASGFIQSSDLRLKKNIVGLENVLEKLKEIRGVKFEWNELYEQMQRGKSGKLNIGVVAQDVEKVFPELVSEWEYNGEKYKAVDYGRLTAVLLEAIKEQQKTIENQQKEINWLKEEIRKLK
ncbi:MAG: hypothetical protein C4278_00630, partial [Patescibacteria group bacterium]